MKTAKHLADNLVALRKTKGMSQEQLAKAAGIPRSTVTHIESGSGNPSLQNLVKISSALQVGIEELLSRPRSDIQLIEAESVVSEKRGRVQIFKMLPEKIKGLDVDKMEFAPGATMGGHPHIGGAKEYFSVVQGEVTVHVAGETFVVKKGAVLAFPGDQSHSYRNTGTGNAVAFSVVVPVSLS